ncbi:MAG: serine hydrolase domain-containing protein [Bacteroidota bacterium]
MAKYIMILLAIVGSLSRGVLLAQVKLDKVLESRIDSIFNDFESHQKPGGSIGIVSDGKVIYEKHFGMQNIRKKIPVSNSTSFNLASISKQFTGMCIALLEEQEKIHLSDDISKYFPQFQFPDTIKIKNLLDHSSGIRDPEVIAMLAGHVNLKGELPGKYLTKDFLFNVLSREQDLNFPTGSEMAYTNINYVLLADIVEQVSGMTFRQFADSAIFKPLKMKDTYVEDFDKGSNVVGYPKKGKSFKRRVQKNGLDGESNVISTLDDLYLWDQNFYSNILGDKNQNLIDKITTSTVLNNGMKSNYNYGLEIDEYKGMKAISHDGEDFIHTSFILRIPEQQLSIICLINSINYIDPIQESYQVLDLIFDKSSKTDTERSEDSYSTIPFKEIQNKIGGYYRIDQKGMASYRKILLNDGKLALSYFPKGKGYPFNSLSNNQFLRYNRAGKPYKLTFKTIDDDSYMIEEFEREPTGSEDWIFKRISELPFDVNEYVGTYIDKQHGAKVKIKKRKNKIIAKKSIIKIPLVQFERDCFYSSEYEVLFYFLRDESGKVESIKVNAIDFRNFGFTKESR